MKPPNFENTRYKSNWFTNYVSPGIILQLLLKYRFEKVTSTWWKQQLEKRSALTRLTLWPDLPSVTLLTALFTKYFYIQVPFLSSKIWRDKTKVDGMGKSSIFVQNNRISGRIIRQNGRIPDIRWICRIPDIRPDIRFSKSRIPDIRKSGKSQYPAG